MLVEIAVVHQGILCRESQVFGEIIIRASFVECFCRIPFCIVSIQVVSSLYIHFILNHWYNPQSVETVSFIADSRQVAIRCATVISVSHGFGKGISRCNMWMLLIVKLLSFKRYNYPFYKCTENGRQMQCAYSQCLNDKVVPLLFSLKL